MSKLVELDKRQLKDYISSKDIYNEILYSQNLASKSFEEQREVQRKILGLLQQYSEYFLTVESKKTYREFKDEIGATLQMLLKKLRLRISDLVEEFEDIHYRIHNFGLTQKLLNEIINNLDESDINQKYLMRMSIIIHDLIKKVKSENLTMQHLNIIRNGLLIITSGKATRDDVRKLDNSLLDNGLDWIYG